MIYRILSFLFLLIFAIAVIFASLPVSLFKKEKPVIHVLLLDLSLSVFIESEDVEKIIGRMEEAIPENDLVVRGFFADKCVFMDTASKKVEAANKKLMLQEWLNGGASYKAYLNLNTSNLEAAVRDAFEKWSDKGLVHIVLVSDGKENNGELVSANELVSQNDLLLTIVPLKETPADIFVKDLIVPENISVNHSFEVETNILATRNFKKVTLQILIDKNEVVQKEVEIRKGKNNFAFSTSFASSGIFEITSKIICDDSFPENNQVAIQVKTTDIKEVLVVTDESNSSLASLVSKYKIISPIVFPRQVSELLKYNSIIFENIHWNNLLDTGKMEALKEYINRGGKLFVSGGAHSFGFGEYMGSPLEKLLPVKINPSGLVGMVIGIDISGSMEGDVNGMRKIDIAINSLLDISKSLEPNDELGVHLYNEKRIKKDLWIPITPIKDFENLMNDKIKIIPKPTGGTFIQPALQTMYDILAANDKKMRIAVLITDGETQESNFEEILSKFQKLNPPISLIVIGADLSPESTLVIAGKKAFGEKWNPVNINNVGWVNLKDCFKEALNKMAAGFSDEGAFKIFANQAHPLGRTIQPFEGPFKGIILKSSLKPGSSALLEIDDRFPLVAHRYLGLGETISFQSGFYENWAGTWLNSAQGKSFQSMIASWLQQAKTNAVTIQVENLHDGVNVTVFSELKSMENYAEVHLQLQGIKKNCVRNSNQSWRCFLSNQEVNNIKSNQVFQILYKGDDEKEGLAAEGIFPTIISKEIYDVYDSTLLAEHFPSFSKKWRWAEEKVPKVDIKSYQPVSNIKFFFLVALFSFLMAIFCRGRAS